MNANDDQLDTVMADDEGRFRVDCVRVVRAGAVSEADKAFKVAIEAPPEGFLDFVSDFRLDDAGIRRMIDRLSLSADLKSRLFALSKLSIRVGVTTIRLGRKILDLVFSLVKQFPQAAFGALLGAIAGALVGLVPVLGWVLGPVVTPILAALGLGAGFFLDFKDKMLKQAIDARLAAFVALPVESHDEK